MILSTRGAPRTVLRTAVSAIALGLGATLALTGCGGDDAKPTAAKSSSATPTPTPTYPAPTAAPAKGKQQTATGYSYRLPKGWQDISSTVKGRGLETAGRATGTTGSLAPNLNTVVTASSVDGTPTKADIAALEQTLKRQVVETAPQIKTGGVISLDGSPAVHQEGIATSSGTKYYLVQYFAMHEGANYGITFGFPREATSAAREKVVQAVLASWTWT